MVMLLYYLLRLSVWTLTGVFRVRAGRAEAKFAKAARDAQAAMPNRLGRDPSVDVTRFHMEYAANLVRLGKAVGIKDIAENKAHSLNETCNWLCSWSKYLASCKGRFIPYAVGLCDKALLVGVLEYVATRHYDTSISGVLSVVFDVASNVF